MVYGVHVCVVVCVCGGMCVWWYVCVVWCVCVCYMYVFMAMSGICGGVMSVVW